MEERYEDFDPDDVVIDEMVNKNISSHNNYDDERSNSKNLENYFDENTIASTNVDSKVCS